MKTVSIVVPCYNEEASLPVFYETVKEHLAFLDERFELIFVDDGSSDRTLSIAKALAEKDRKVRYLSFSRNFGKEAAMYAGLEHAAGDYVAIMDADLQDPPELLKGNVQYSGDRALRLRGNAPRRPQGRTVDPVFFSRAMFYAFIAKISQTKILDGVLRDFRMMRRNMVNAILSLKEKNRFSKRHFQLGGVSDKIFDL